MAEIISLGTDNFSRVVNHGLDEAVIYFFASWCRPCRTMRPVFDELVLRGLPSGVSFGIVDIGQAPTIAQTYGIRSVPSVGIFRQGKLLAVVPGEVSIDEVLSRVQRALGPQFL
ncbi:thioredoxin family protein [Achromobacter anxifer]|uniref:Thioredoxin 1 n=2 Tax=Pseudomonas TaxID=286 RepID=A0A1G7UNS1_9PSED|nr:thioredoxin family protein [Pseudomonas veronii]SDG49156.1 thioredoxin 1 [Pseudomonas abietaniphila]